MLPGLRDSASLARVLSGVMLAAPAEAAGFAAAEPEAAGLAELATAPDEAGFATALDADAEVADDEAAAGLEAAAEGAEPDVEAAGGAAVPPQAVSRSAAVSAASRRDIGVSVRG